MKKINISDEIIEKYKYSIQKIREDRSSYFEYIKNEIDTVIAHINKFDKIYIMGGLGSRLIKASSTFYNQFLATYNGPGKEEIQEDKFIQEDDEVEILLEYVMSIATATINSNRNVIPTQNDIEIIYQQLLKIKTNINFWELSADDSVKSGSEFDNCLSTNVMFNSINVRGDGYQIHIQEIYQEMFRPFDEFLDKFYKFNSNDIYNTIQKLDSLVYSKVGNPFGALQTHKRFTDSKIFRIVVA